MSNRDSLGFGELLPQDVVEIFAHEKQSKNGRKKRSHSLGRALGWLKGKKRKDLGSKGQNPGLGPALDLALDGHPAGHKGGHKSGKQAHPQGNNHAVPKRDDDDGKTPAPPLFQENVFIETSRPKYLEDLHTEALEGLKMMQQEETNIGGEYQDNESTISTLTVQTDGEGGGFMTDTTIPDTSSVVSMQSSASTKSSRSGLTRQASTFRPLNPGKKSEKSKTRRRHRKTVAGIPHHVQKELGLDRVGWILTPKLDEEQLYNGESDYSSTTEGPLTPDSPDGAISSLQSTNVIHPLSKDKVELLNAAHAAHAGHRDDLALLHHLGPDISGGQRPRSLAVPWMTTSLQQEPPSPVMSMSPQAAYMSKIIPNAVLPPSIDVVEISRGRSRNSVRTVSKSSLVLSSPAPSRASSRASSSRTTSTTITSASRHNYPNMSDSNWSNSESSNTLMSDSSTISNSSTPRQKRSHDGDASAKKDKVSLPSKSTSNGKLVTKGDDIKKEGQFARSLSVMKAKRAPPPPSRSYSLHNKMKRRSRDLAEVKVISGEPSLQSISAQDEENEKYKPGSSPVPSKNVDSPGYNADTSSLDDSTASFSPISQLQVLKTEDVKKVAETISKDASQEKQEQIQENKLNKVISPSSGYSSQDATSPKLSKQPVTSSPRHKKGILAKLQRLFPGSTSAGSPSSPPTQPKTPESAKSTGEAELKSVDTAIVSPSVQALRALFNIPPHPKVHAPPPPPPDVWAHNSRTIELILGPPAPGNTYSIVKKNPKDRRQQRQSPPASAEGSVKSLVVERKQKSPAVESVNGSLRVLETKKVQESEVLIAEIHKENTERLAQDVDLKGNSKDEKVRASDILNGMLVKAVEKRKERLAAKREEAAVISTQATEIKTTMDTLPAVSLVRISPSPLLAHHPVPPLSTETADVASDTTVVVSQESSWPPPPPPMAQVTLSGPDELDFPLPPPPLFAERPVLPVQVPPDGDSSCRTASVVVKTESVKVITAAESQKPTTSQETPLNIPPPPPYSAPPPPTAAVFAPTVNKVPPPLIVCLPPPKEVSPTPPPPPAVLSVRPKESSAPVAQDVVPLKNISSTLVTIVSPSPVKDVSPPPVIEVTPPSAKGVSNLPPDHVPPPPPQDVASQSAEEVQSVSRFALPQSIPPPPPLPSQPQSSMQKIIVLQESIPLKPETTLVSSNSILATPQSIPAPPPTELLYQAQVIPLKSDGQATQETAPSPPSEVSVPAAPEKAHEPPPSPPIKIPLPPPLPVQGLGSIKHQLSQLSTQNQSQEQTSAPVVHEEPTPIVTPSLLQMIKLRSVNSSPEPPKVQEPPQAEVTMRKQQPNNQVPTSSSGSEPPQKPIRRSLIVTSPTSTSPPTLVTSPLILPQSQTVMNPPQEMSIVVSPEEKSSEMTVTPIVVPPAFSSTLVSPEKNPPEMTTTTAVMVPSVSSSMLVSPEKNPAEMTTTTALIAVTTQVPPVSSSTVISPEKKSPEMTATPSIVVSPVSSSTLVSPDKNLPEMTQTTSVMVPPMSSFTVISPEEKSPPEGTATPSIVVPPASSSTLVSPEKNPPEMTTTASVVVPPVSSSTVISPEKTSPPEMMAITSFVVPPVSSSTIVSPEKKSLELTATPSVMVPPTSSSTVISPVKTSPPATTVTPSVVIPPVSSSTVISPVKKSPPATTTPHSMNLQEAIRLRTAARSKAGPASRLSLHSPTSPKDFHKSPTSTASFIFSKSNKRVVIETKPVLEVKGDIQKNLEVSSVAKVISETESLKKGIKVPPPVAKKPKTKSKEVETSEGTEQTAGQEAQLEVVKDAADKTNGTAGTVEGERMVLT